MNLRRTWGAQYKLLAGADGMVFNKLGYLTGGRRVDYPHVIEHGNFVFVAFSGGRQTVEVLRISMEDLNEL